MLLPTSTPLRRLRGFTLFELLVVLVLMGLMAGLVAPAGWRALENAARRGAAADVQAWLSSLPLRSFQKGERFVLAGEALARAFPDLPADCRLQAGEPLVYGANGMAAGGRVKFLCAGEAARVFVVAPVTGVVSLQGEGRR